MAARNMPAKKAEHPPITPAQKKRARQSLAGLEKAQRDLLLRIKKHRTYLAAMDFKDFGRG